MYGERKHVGTKVPATQFYYRYQGEGVLCEMRNCEKVYFAGRTAARICARTRHEDLQHEVPTKELQEVDMAI